MIKFKFFSDPKITKKDTGDLQALNVLFNYQATDLEVLDKTQEILERVVSFRNAGKYDGYELSKNGESGVFFFKAQSSENLYKMILPVLKDIPFLKGAEVQLQTHSSQDNENLVKTFVI
ncbi:hypothetical protein [uncultured Mucilaginibacter sp.]|uniref:hypothetical protein n=1 Tax=uncultured Mucilaginibacter sp. TaxID=797541 RepID=UPI0025F97149|nr:hypothetical protein [uncultured Mucilaginibacter sp.]